MVQRCSRRAALKSAMAAFGAVIGAAAFQPRTTQAAAVRAGRLLVPGYRSGMAEIGGRPVTDLPGVNQVPSNWNGRRAMLSMLDLADPTGQPRRVVLPTRGHGTIPGSPTQPGVFVGMECGSIAGFDPDSLGLVAIGVPRRDGWLIGGHGVRLPGGAYVAISERAPPSPASGNLAADVVRLEGRIVIRDAATLKPVDDFPSYGIRPHQIELTEDGRYLVVANYGSTAAEGDGPEDYFAPSTILAPCIAVIETASGRLVERIAGANPEVELRHLVAPRLDRIFVITARLDYVGAGDTQDDPEAPDGLRYVEARPVRVEGGRAVRLLSEQAHLTRHGLSLGYHAATDAVLMAFPGTHTIAVLDGATAAVRKLIDTAALGLHWPCGLAPTPDGRRWLVTGYWRGVLTLRSEDWRMEVASPLPQWWGHSHTVMA